DAGHDVLSMECDDGQCLDFSADGTRLVVTEMELIGTMYVALNLDITQYSLTLFSFSFRPGELFQVSGAYACNVTAPSERVLTARRVGTAEPAAVPAKR